LREREREKKKQLKKIGDWSGGQCNIVDYGTHVPAINNDKNKQVGLMEWMFRSSSHKYKWGFPKV